ncbi:MAG: STAS domain-containing protein [Actinomycetota bacterium]|nr:STAS domain-containing protein [Actinomycetota bacterium]
MTTIIDSTGPGDHTTPTTPADHPDFERLLFALCGQAIGDVHLDLAESAAIEVAGVVILLRGAATLPTPHHLVLHNPPSSLNRVLAQLGIDPEAAHLRLA